MQAYLTLVRRELAGYFLSIMGYVVIAAIAFLIGLSFVDVLVNSQGKPMLVPVTELFFMTLFFWILLLITTPVITMRLFALEKFSGTFETLMTAPVTDMQVVAAKFTAAMIFYTLMWLPLFAAMFIVRSYTNDPGALTPHILGSTVAGIILFGCLYISVGCFASALTRSQTTAAMISFGLGIGLFLLSFLAPEVPGTDLRSQVLSWFSLPQQMHDFARGVIDTRPIVLCLSLTFVFLFLTLRVVESRRWK